MRKKKCDKKREVKDVIEKAESQAVINFLSDEVNLEKAVKDVLNYYDTRTNEKSLKAVKTKIANVEKGIEEQSSAFIKAKSELLRNAIEKKMEEYEILLNDLKYQEAQLELERGYKISKKDIVEFIGELLKGDVNDKEYQRKIIDNLVSQVFVHDDNTIVYFNIKGGKDIDLLDINDTNIITSNSNSVRMQSPLSAIKKEGYESFFFF